MKSESVNATFASTLGRLIALARYSLPTSEKSSSKKLDGLDVDDRPTSMVAGEKDTIPAPRKDEFPRHFGKYALLNAFAQGGMGEVYLAKSGGTAGIDRLCVLKKLRQDVNSNQEYVRRFIDEARLVVQLNHAKICHVFDVGRVGHEYFLAMEYVSGVNLRKLQNRSIARSNPISVPLALFIVREVLEALDYAHRVCHPLTGQPLNLVHRDVSPQNVMLNYEGEVKLIDFGLAESELKEEQTESQVVMGKVAYMSPEQARGDNVCPKADQFAAAVVAYELLLGGRFYGSMNNYEVWQVVGRGGFSPPGFSELDPQLASILKIALQKDKNKRFRSCSSFGDAIDLFLADHHPGSQQKAARECMLHLFDVDKEAERKFLARFVNVQVPGHEPGPDDTGLSSGNGLHNLILDDKSRPIPQDEVQAFLTKGQPVVNSDDETVDETMQIRRTPMESDTLAAQRAALSSSKTMQRAVAVVVVAFGVGLLSYGVATNVQDGTSSPPAAGKTPAKPKPLQTNPSDEKAISNSSLTRENAPSLASLEKVQPKKKNVAALRQDPKKKASSKKPLDAKKVEKSSSLTPPAERANPPRVEEKKEETSTPPRRISEIEKTLDALSSCEKPCAKLVSRSLKGKTGRIPIASLSFVKDCRKQCR
ncbi:MAG: serine/threonine protein kinase [Deltaproteobacteria bacterium]|nr:serine/threonine protein kinase [Deltaproteobacteria bacterium]